MISLSSFKDNLLALFRVMTRPENTGMYLDVVYKGQLYRITVEDLNQRVKQQRRPRARDLTHQISTRRCPNCRKLMLNNVCMNSLCADNARLSKVQV